MLRPPLPPFAVGNSSFRFPALAALAGRLPIGAGREGVIATLLAARMAADAAAPRPLPRSARAIRAVAARQRLSGMCPDARIRAACIALAEATANDAPDTIARALARVMDVTAPLLDAGARLELAELGQLFGAGREGQGERGRGGGGA